MNRRHAWWQWLPTAHRPLPTVVWALLIVASLLADAAGIEAAPIPPSQTAPPSVSALSPLPDTRSGDNSPLAWATAAALPRGERWALAGAAHFNGTDCRFYTMGGIGANNTLYNYAEVYDQASNAWFQLPDLPAPVGGLHAATIGNRIYVAGGYYVLTPQAAIPTNALWAYDTTTNAWDTSLAPMPAALATAAMASVRGKLYIFGGDNGDSDSNNTTYEYNPATNAWTQKADMPTARENNVAVTFQDKIYVVGGLRVTPQGVGPSLKTVEVYDPVANTWTTKAQLRIERASPGIATDGRFIYVYGGMVDFNGGDILDSVERYDPATNTWEDVAEPMVTATVGPAFAFLMGRIWATGGQGDGASYLSTHQYLTVGGNRCLPSSVTLAQLSATPVPIAASARGLWLLLVLLALAGGLSVRYFSTKTRRHQEQN
jgi:N-acetylneuraminic acid mutarotase